MGRAAKPDKITPSCSAKPDAAHAFVLEATSAATLQVGIGGVLGPAQCVTAVPKMGTIRRSDAWRRRRLRATGRMLIRAGLRARGRKMAISGNQVVNTDVTTLESSTAESVRERAAALDEPASATRIQTVVARHLRSFDAELGRTRPSLLVHHVTAPRLMTISDGASRPPLDTLPNRSPADLPPTTPLAVPADRTESFPLEQAIAGGTPQSVGSWRFYFADERWEWSPEVERIHGYEPGTVTPTTRLVLYHKHPDDLGHVAATLDDIRRTHQPFSTRHRIIDAHGQTREVVVIGEGLQDQGGDVVGTQGFYLDVTPSLAQQQESISRAVAAISDGRSLIDQVRGILVVVYRIDADAAFGVWRSQVTNTKLRAFAEQLMSDIRELEYDGQLPRRTVFDQLLLTAHERVTK